MDLVTFSGDTKGPKSISPIGWNLPLTVSVVPVGDANDPSMRVAGRYQTLAENQFLLDKNSILSGQLCVASLQLDLARNEVKTLKEDIQNLRLLLSATYDEVKRLRKDDPIAKAQFADVMRMNSATYTPPNSISDMFTSPNAPKPITISCVICRMKYDPFAQDIEKLSDYVREAYVQEYGHEPETLSYYEREGDFCWCSSYTEHDSAFIERVLRSCPLVVKKTFENQKYELVD